MKVFILWHTHKDSDLSGREDVKLLGVYSSMERAEEGKKKSILLPGFREHLEDFEIDEYTLDKDHWIHGFTTEE